MEDEKSTEATPPVLTHIEVSIRNIAPKKGSKLLGILTNSKIIFFLLQKLLACLEFTGKSILVIHHYIGSLWFKTELAKNPEKYKPKSSSSSTQQESLPNQRLET